MPLVPHNTTTDLDGANAPEDVARILRNAADKYSQDFIDLQSAWQDSQAGRPWATIARELEKLADKLDRII